jgi:hypothetical protein
MSVSCGCYGSCAACGSAEIRRPGLSRLAYRLGEHATLLQQMKDGLSRPGRPALTRLTARQNDLSTALLDAAAVVGDIVAFYQERIVNEGYLRTATEPFSVMELARLVGHRPHPGLSASADLAFTVESTAETAFIPAGTKVSSVPGPGEDMQTFETSASLTARPPLNAMRPRLTRPLRLTPDLARRIPVLHVRGAMTGLQPGILLLFAFDGGLRILRTIHAVTPDGPADITRLTLVPMTWRDQPAVEIGKAIAPLLERSIERAAASHLARLSRFWKGRLDAIGNAGPDDLAGDLIVEPSFENMRAAESEMIGKFNAALDALDVREPAAVGKPFRGLPDFLGSTAAQLAATPASSGFMRRRLAAFPLKADSLDQRLRLISALQPELGSRLLAAVKEVSAPDDHAVTVHALRLRARVFGHNSQGIPILGGPENERSIVDYADWTPELVFSDVGGTAPDGEVSNIPDTEVPYVIYLDAPHLEIAQGGWAVVERADAPLSARRHRIFRLTRVDGEVSRRAYGMSGAAARLALRRDDREDERAGWFGGESDGEHRRERELGFLLIRETRIHTASERLVLAGEPIQDDVGGSSIELDCVLSGLEVGRALIVTGERTDVPGPDGKPLPGLVTSELAMVAAVEHDLAPPEGPERKDSENGFAPGETPHTRIELATPLAYTYRRSTVRIAGNVVAARHGEVRGEPVIYDPATRMSSIRDKPLTYVAAEVPSGALPAFELTVDGVRWRQVEDLLASGPEAHVYSLRTDQNGAASIAFGDGVHGAAPPTAPGAVMARYRVGLGRGGNIRPNQLSLLTARPLGVKEVTNPLPATGGADRDGPDQIRRNAPQSTLAFGRVVSVADIADFALNFAGVGKVHVTELAWHGVQVAHVTVAAADDAPLDEGSDLLDALRRSLARFGDPSLPVRVSPRRRLVLSLTLDLSVSTDRSFENVEAAVRARLGERFGFAAREIAESVVTSQIVAVAQSVGGVEHCRLGSAALISETDLLTGGSTGSDAPVPGRLPVRAARLEGRDIRVAELACIAPTVPETLILREIRP